MSTSEEQPPGSPPRHPSAGNLSARPTAVSPTAPPESLPLASYPVCASIEAGGLELGPGLDHEMGARLLGNVDGKRVLDLGCGSGQASIAMARLGAKVIAVDTSVERLGEARASAEEAGVTIEFHHGDLAELAFIRGDGIDVAVSVYSLAAVADLGRVFRQVERVLRSEAALLFSLPHPLALSTEFGRQPSPVMVRTQFDATPINWAADDLEGTVLPHRITDVFTTLVRSNFRVDTLLEPPSIEPPEPIPHWTPLAEWLPTTVVFRGRKQAS